MNKYFLTLIATFLIVTGSNDLFADTVTTEIQIENLRKLVATQQVRIRRLEEVDRVFNADLNAISRNLHSIGCKVGVITEGC